MDRKELNINDGVCNTYFIPCCLKFCKVLAFSFIILFSVCGVLVSSVQAKRSDHVRGSPETKGHLKSLISLSLGLWQIAFLLCKDAHEVLDRCLAATLA